MIDLFLKKIKESDTSKNAIIFGDQKLKYSELLDKINSIYLLISTSFDENKIVVIKGDYSFNSIALIFALVKHKCVFIPIISDNQTELDKKIEISNPDYVIDSTDIEVKPYEKKISESNDYYTNLFNNDRSGLVLFSSGSTGLPKAMVHDFDNLLSTYLNVKPKNLTFLVFLMFDHIGGLNTMLNIISMGSTMVIPEKRDPEIIGHLIQQYKVNILPASPTFLNLMNIGGVFDKYDFSSLKLITYGTEPMPKSLLDILKIKTPKTRLIQTFGTSETGIIKTKSKSSSSLLIKFDDDDQEVKIIEGELWIKSKTRVLGYINHNNDSFTNDGWFRTGDLGIINDNGILKIVGRTKEIIVRGAEKISPLEVDNCLLMHPSIDQVVTFAVKHKTLGEDVAAAIVLQPDVQLTEQEIKTWARQQLSSFKVPKQIILVDSIPKGSTGKVQRIGLAEKLGLE